MFQSTVRPHWSGTTHTPSPIDAEAECRAAEQEQWEVADDLDADQEVREQEPIDDRPEDWAFFERDIEEAQYQLDELLPE
jgi:hypothetical protein